MSGKSALILVIGFSLIFLMMGRYWDELTTRAVDNHVEYYKGTIAHNIAVSGANIALYNICKDPSWHKVISQPFDKGTMYVQFDTTSKLVVSTGSFMGTERKVKVKLGKSSFAKYAWFTGQTFNSKVFVTGDTIWGGMHSNQKLNINGDPVFFGKVTISGDLHLITEDSHPKFLGGLAKVQNIEFPPNFQFETQKNAAQSGGKYYDDGQDLWLTFNANGTITYRRGSGSDSSKYTTPETVSLSSYTPNGIIYVGKGNIYVSGTLKGQATIVADQSSGLGGKGNVYFVNDLVYSKPPMLKLINGDYSFNPECTDLMGVMASNNAFIATTLESSAWKNNVINKDLKVDAGIFCANGGLKVELNPGVQLKDIPPAGIFYLNGSMVVKNEQEISIMNAATNIVSHGYSKHIVFDERFHNGAPLYWVLLSNYEVVSWLEGIE